MAVFSLIAGVCRGLVRVAVRALLWASDRLAHLFRRRPAYNTLLLDITAPPAEEPTTALRALLHSQPPDLLTLTSLLRWAREDERILAVVVTVSQLDMGWARVQSLRRSLLELRQAGKQVWVYLAEAHARQERVNTAALGRAIGLPQPTVWRVRDRVAKGMAGGDPLLCALTKGVTR